MTPIGLRLVGRQLISLGSDVQRALRHDRLRAAVRIFARSHISSVDGWCVVHVHSLVRLYGQLDTQALATPRPVDPGGVSDVTRMKVVTATAIAPMTENTSCQVSEGMVCFTMPCVA